MLKRILLSAIALLGSLSCSSTSAQVVNATCYMKTATGQIIDLGVSMCGDTAAVASKSGSGGESSFLAEFKELIANQPGNEVVMRLATNNPASLIRGAQNYCQSRRAGLSDAQITRNEAKTIVNSSPSLKSEMVTMFATQDILAPKYFCPEFANR